MGPQNPSWTFTAVDPAPAMLELARDKVRCFELTERVRFVEGTIEDVDETHLYDAATFMLVLHFIEDDAVKLQQLKSIRKRLKSGAPFVCCDVW